MRVRYGTRHGTELPKLPVFLYSKRPSVSKSKCYWSSKNLKLKHTLTIDSDDYMLPFQILFVFPMIFIYRNLCVLLCFILFIYTHIDSESYTFILIIFNYDLLLFIRINLIVIAWHDVIIDHVMFCSDFLMGKVTILVGRDLMYSSTAARYKNVVSTFRISYCSRVKNQIHNLVRTLRKAAITTCITMIEGADK